MLKSIGFIFKQDTKVQLWFFAFALSLVSTPGFAAPNLTPYEYCTQQVTEQINSGYADFICKEADAHNVADLAGDIYPKLHSHAQIDLWTLAAFWVSPTALLKNPGLIDQFYEQSALVKPEFGKYDVGFAPSYAMYKILRAQPDFNSEWATRCRAEAAPKIKLKKFENEMSVEDFLKAVGAKSNYPTNAELMLQICNNVNNEYALDCVKTLHKRRDKRYTHLLPSDFLALRACWKVQTAEQNTCVKENLWPSFFWDFFSPVSGVEAMNIVLKCVSN